MIFAVQNSVWAPKSFCKLYFVFEMHPILVSFLPYRWNKGFQTVVNIMQIYVNLYKLLRQNSSGQNVYKIFINFSRNCKIFFVSRFSEIKTGVGYFQRSYTRVLNTYSKI